MLSVLDGAVLVISAVEGVQAQTRVLMRTLQRLRIPTLIFVNKIDRARRATTNACCESICGEADAGDRRDGLGRASSARARADVHAVRRGRRRVRGAARGRARRARRGAPGRVRRRRGERLVRAAPRRARGADRAGARASGVLRLGDHRRGRGCADRPASPSCCPAAEGDADGPVSGTRLQGRARSGRREDRVRPDVLGHGPDARPAAVRPRRRAEGDRDQRLRPRLGRRSARRSPPGRSASSGGSATSGSATRSATAPTALERTTSRRRRWRRSSSRADADDAGALRVALDQLAEQDPLINVRQDDARQEISVSLYGEVQKEVIQATLANDFGIDVEFRETTTICIERPVGTGDGGRDPARRRRTRSRATIGLRIEPAPIDSGVEFRLDVDSAAVPLYIYKTVDSFVEAMTQYVARHAAGGSLRLAGHRLRRDDDRLRLLRPRRPDEPASDAAHHGRRLPQAHAVGADAGARAGAGRWSASRSCASSLEIPTDTVGAVLRRAGTAGRRRASPSRCGRPARRSRPCCPRPGRRTFGGSCRA